MDLTKISREEHVELFKKWLWERINKELPQDRYQREYLINLYNSL